MKPILVILLCSLNFAAMGQVKLIYFAGNVVTTDSTRATSYAVYGKLANEDLWVCKQYNLSGYLINTGSYKDSLLSVPHGLFTYYDDIEFYNKLNYTSYSINDKFKFISMRGAYKDGFRDGKWITFFPDGKIAGLVFYQLGKANGEYKLYDRKGNILQSGQYLDGKKEGNWLVDSGKKTEVYKMDQLITTIKNKRDD